MASEVDNVVITINTWGDLITLHNQISYLMTNEAITANSDTGTTTGDAILVGSFQANTINAVGSFYGNDAVLVNAEINVCTTNNGIVNNETVANSIVAYEEVTNSVIEYLTSNNSVLNNSEINVATINTANIDILYATNAEINIATINTSTVNNGIVNNETVANSIVEYEEVTNSVIEYLTSNNSVLNNTEINVATINTATTTDLFINDGSVIIGGACTSLSIGNNTIYTINSSYNGGKFEIMISTSDTKQFSEIMVLGYGDDAEITTYATLGLGSSVTDDNSSPLGDIFVTRDSDNSTTDIILNTVIADTSVNFKGNLL